MLFRLDDSIIAYANRGKEEERVVRVALENILGCYREGSHIVVCTPALCLAIKNRLFNNSTTQVWLLRSLAEEWPILSGHFGKIGSGVEISGDVETAQATDAGSFRLLRVPIKMFAKVGLTQPSTVLTENLDDADFLGVMARVYAAQNGLSPILKLNKVGGGGSTTAQQFANIQSNQCQFCLCVVDSDKKSPDGGIGDTSKAVRRIHDVSNPLVAVAITPCHELENTIPEALFQVISGSPTVLASAESISALKAHASPGSFEHVDFKNGVKLLDLITFGHGSPDSTFWAGSLAKAKAKAGASLTVSEACLKNWACNNTAACSCVLLHPLGDNLLRNCNVYFEDTTVHRIKRLIDPHCQPMWTHLGRIVFEWCCGWRERIT